MKEKKPKPPIRSLTGHMMERYPHLYQPKTLILTTSKEGKIIKFEPQTQEVANEEIN